MKLVYNAQDVDSLRQYAFSCSDESMAAVTRALVNLMRPDGGEFGPNDLVDLARRVKATIIDTAIKATDHGACN